MGLLSQGRPLNWDETKRYAKYVQERGIAQFINIYHRSKDRADAPFKWGDEVCVLIEHGNTNIQCYSPVTTALATYQLDSNSNKHDI